MGSRGPVMIILAYIAGKILFTNAKKWIKFAVVLSILLAAIVFLNASVYLSVLNSIRNVFNLIGLPTRVLDYAINGTILSHMSERDILFRIALQRIIERPLWGYGVYGEWAWLGWNVHNMYLEFLVHYGVLLGSLLVIWLVGFVISTYLKTSSVECRELILIYSCLVFVRGFFGGSYLNYNTLFLVAVCFNAKRRICNVNAFQGSITKKPMASNT